MSTHDRHDPLLHTVSRLRPLEPDSARAERVRTRCRARLNRSRRRSERVARITGLAVRVLAPMVVGSLGAMYIAALVGTTLRLHSVFH
jgi:hypothetical protein